MEIQLFSWKKACPPVLAKISHSTGDYKKCQNLSTMHMFWWKKTEFLSFFKFPFFGFAPFRLPFFFFFFFFFFLTNSKRRKRLSCSIVCGKSCNVGFTHSSKRSLYNDFGRKDSPFLLECFSLLLESFEEVSERLGHLHKKLVVDRRRGRYPQNIYIPLAHQWRWAYWVAMVRGSGFELCAGWQSQLVFHTLSKAVTKPWFCSKGRRSFAVKGPNQKPSPRTYELQPCLVLSKSMFSAKQIYAELLHFVTSC